MNMVKARTVAQRFVPGDGDVLAIGGFPLRRINYRPWRIRMAVRGVLALLGIPVGIWGPLQAPRNICGIAGAAWRRGGAGEAWRTLGMSVRAVCSGSYIVHRPHGGLSGYPTDLPPSPPDNRGRLLAADQVAELFPPELGIGGRWVRDHVPSSIKLGRKRMWFEEDVWAFLRSRRDHS